MSTNPTPQPQAIPTSQLVSDFHAELAKVTHRTITLSYGILAILVLFVAMAGVGGYLGLKEFNAQADKAAAERTVYLNALKDFQANYAQNEAARQASEAKVAILEAQIAHRSSVPLPAPVQAGLAPNATNKEAANALEALWASDKTFGPITPSNDLTVDLSVSQAQKVAMSKVQLDLVSANFQDEKQVVDLQTGSISSLNKDLTQCRSTLDTANKTIADYKKIVAPSRFKKFLSGAKTFIMVVGAAYIGHKL